MSWMGRFINLCRRGRTEEEIRAELASHIEEAVERGRSPEEARRAFGHLSAYRERSRDVRILPGLDALASDVVFGCRQLRKRPVVSAAAILSLALAIGATTAAFRLIDAVLLRTLPVSHPERLFYLTTNFVDRQGRPVYRDDFDYPSFREYREVAAGLADLLVVGMSSRQEAALDGGSETEPVYRQYLSGNVFGVFGLKPALGRLLAPHDDLTPGASPVAVLSYDYWTRRFGRDPHVLERSFRIGGDRFQIIGVAPRGFIGTEPGVVTDVFLPSMMNTEAIHSPGWSWFRIWVHPKSGVSSEQALQPLQAHFLREQQERVKEFQSDTPRTEIETFLQQRLSLLPAAAGASEMQRQYRRPLFIMAALVALVLLIACLNVGNLLAAQAASRAREMALRVSIGAGRWRLIQLVLVESFLLAAIASVIGTFFASWSAPLVISMLQVPEDPVRLVLDSGWQGWAFTIALTFFTALLFGLVPALRASGVKPMAALKGNSNAGSHRRGMYALLAAQMAFCILVQFVAGLFVATFQHLATRPLGFNAANVLEMDAAQQQVQSPRAWLQIASQFRALPGVESVALAGWPLLSQIRWTLAVRVPGHAVEAQSPHALDVSPGFFHTMQIEWVDGRDFRNGDLPPRLGPSSEPLPGVGIVNQAFARLYFGGASPVGRTILLLQAKEIAAPMEIVGCVRDAVYSDIHEPMRPTVYLPQMDRNINTFILRTRGNPLALAPAARGVLSKARPDLRIHTVQPQMAFVRWQLLRERLLAALSLFFALVALVLAAVGLYGLLNYSVTSQRRDIGIRMALGARPGHVVASVSTGLMGMVALGLMAGLAAGIACGRFVESLLYEVKATDPASVLLPLMVLTAAVLLAALPPAIRAVHIDPAQALRSD